MSVRTRFAPSPTGSLHLGGARTAIFNWLFARHHGGEFVLRIEDTDQARSTEQSLNEILDSMIWMGLDWDGNPIKQSERLDLYKEHANKLLESGKAYKCYVTPEELAEKRKEAQEKGEFFQYKREWADENAGPDKPYSLRLLTPDDGEIEVNDILRGKISFDAKEIDDFIILRMDGYATYNFAVVIDDALMEVSHIIRGDDHLINTPKQLLIYKALSFKIPEFAHVSMIHGADKTKLSKRHGATSVEAYRKDGYLPEAMINYLTRLGWSYGDEEIFSKEELVDKFTLDNVGKSPAVFNPEKLLWLNAHYIKEKPAKELAELILPLMRKKGFNAEIDDKLLMIIEQLRERSKTIDDFVTQSSYFYSDDFQYEENGKNKFLNEDSIPVFKAIIEKLTSLENFDHDSIYKAFEEVMTGRGLKFGKIAQPT
ncbi:MAG: glutamate--tRNA ligase, partial [Thermodesulfobacteriota bacterium]